MSRQLILCLIVVLAAGSLGRVATPQSPDPPVPCDGGLPGDLDGDGDIGLSDYEIFVGCMTGPDGGPVGSACAASDLTGDGDVDLADVKQFFEVFSGELCPAEPRLDNHSGSAMVPINTLLPDEQVGALFDVPNQQYPIEILQIGVGWASQFGSNPPQQEKALHIYPDGLPDPGMPQFTMAGPILADGIVNEFDISAMSGDRIISAGPFTVALELLNQGSTFSSAPVHDNAGCVAGQNVVFVIPGGWQDACPLGVPGNWVFHVVYRQIDCQ